MKTLIMGAGSLGSVVGGFLAKAGHDVTFVGRPDHMTAIERDGLYVHGIWGDHRITSLRTVTSCALLPGETFELVILSVKSYDTRQAVREVCSLVAQDGLVVSFQNGLGNVEAIAESVGHERTLGATVIFGVRTDKPGHVTVTVYANEVRIGSLAGAVSFDRVQKVAELIDASGIPTLAAGEMEKHIWGKVLYNSALNPLSAILNATYGELSEEAATREVMNAVVEEIFDVARARGVTLFWDKAEGFLRVFYDELVPPTAGHYASMLQDLERGGKTEIESLNGAIVRYGREAGLACPVNEVLANIIRVMERTYGIRSDER